MKTQALTLSLLLLAASSPAFGVDLDRKVLESFAPLVNTVRGAVRMQLERGNGCLPWVRLARDPSNSKTYEDFGFSPELVKELDGAPNSKIVPPIARFAAEGGYTTSVLGRCGDDVVVSGKTLGVIELTLEQIGREPILIRFPYELSDSRQLTYHLDKVAYSGTEPLILPASRRAQ